LRLIGGKRPNIARSRSFIKEIKLGSHERRQTPVVQARKQGLRGENRSTLSIPKEGGVPREKKTTEDKRKKIYYETSAKKLSP